MKNHNTERKVRNGLLLAVLLLASVAMMPAGTAQAPPVSDSGGGGVYGTVIRLANNVKETAGAIAGDCLACQVPIGVPPLPNPPGPIGDVLDDLAKDIKTLLSKRIQL